MKLYIPNLILLASRLRDWLDHATKRHESLFMLSCAVIAWLTLELATPLGPVFGNPLAQYPIGFTTTWGTLMVLVFIFAITAITNHLRYIGEAYLITLVGYCLPLGLMAGGEYAITCGMYMVVFSFIVYVVVMKFIDLAYNGATE